LNQARTGNKRPARASWAGGDNKIKKTFLYNNRSSYPRLTDKDGRPKTRLPNQKTIASTMLWLWAFRAVQGAPGFRVLVCQSHPDKPSHRHGRNDLFLISEGSQGLEFVVRKPDGKFPLFHGFVFTTGPTSTGR
jgi:hypothetical protein